MKIFYTPRQSVDVAQGFSSEILPSPSAKKPAQIAEAFRNIPGVEFVNVFKRHFDYTNSQKVFKPTNQIILFDDE